MSGELHKLRQGTGRDLHPLQIKLTYVGAQLKGIASVAFTTFYHRLDMAWFVPLRQRGVSYGNDDADIWNFTVTPEEIARVVQGLATVAATIGKTASPEISLMLVLKRSRLGDTGAEILLDAPQSANVQRAILEALDPDNGLARRVMTMHAESVRGMRR